jgi:hypothetical protein
MATYQAPFQRDAISEVVPRSLELSSLSKSSLLTGRRRIRVIPQTGQTYGSASGQSGMIGSGQPTLANILLQDSAGLLDMQSVVLSMNVQCQTVSIPDANNGIKAAVAGTVLTASANPYIAALGASGRADATSAATTLPSGPGAPNAVTFNYLNLANDNDPLVTATLDDFAWSVFRRIQISLNSQLVDDLDYCGRRATTEVYMSASPSWYDTIGTIMGSWKYVTQEQTVPLIVTPTNQADTANGPGGVAISTFPIKSRVRSLYWTAYTPAAAVTGGGPGPAQDVIPTAGSGIGDATGLQLGQVGGNKSGQDFAWAVNPVALAPQASAAVARQDVLSKLYSTSIYMKNVFFTSQTPAAPGNQKKIATLDDNPDLSNPNLNVNVLASGGAVTAGPTWSVRPTPGVKFSIPLGMLSHLFRQEQLFPLRNAGQLILQVQFADAQECCYAGWLAPLSRAAAGAAGLTDRGGFTTPGNVGVSYLVQNLELECDIVTAIPEYTAILDSICSRPADKGLAIAFDSHLTSLQQVSGLSDSSYGKPLGGSSATQSYTLIASKGSENVRSFHWTFSPGQGLRSPFYLANSTFPCYNISQWQIRVGSVYYPAFPSKGLSKNYMEMLSSMNAPMASIGQASIINYNMYKSSTPSQTWYLQSPSLPAPAAGAGLGIGFSVASTALETYRYDPRAGVFADISTADPVTNTLVIDPTASFMSDAYIGGYCFDNLKHAEPLSHDGLDTRAIAGGMIQLDFTCQPLEAFCVVFHIRFTRTIVLAENGVSIVG